MSEMSEYEPAIFTHRGRIGRMRYVAYSLLYTIVVTIVLVGMAMVVGGSEDSVTLGLVVMAAFLFSYFIPMIRRLNDLDKTGWISLLTFVPVANLLLYLYLLLFPGTDGRNSYGLPPTGNSIGVVIASLALPVLVFISFAGIIMTVALPSYNDYIEAAETTKKEYGLMSTEPQTEDYESGVGTLEATDDTSAKIRELQAKLQTMQSESAKTLVTNDNPAMANSDLQECAILDQGPGIVDVDLAKKAADCYATVVKNDSSNADAYYGLGVSHYLIGFSTKNVLELKKSQEALKKAVELNPDHAQAKDQLMTTEGWIGMLGG